MKLQMQKVDSSSLKAIDYKGDALYVMFQNGTIYRYKDVPRHVYAKMLQSQSIGSFFYKSVRQAFEYDRVDPKQVEVTLGDEVLKKADDLKDPPNIKRGARVIRTARIIEE